MGRSKVAMEPINNDKKRKLTFQRRKDSIIKKAFELTTLCDVNVSMIICTDHQEPQIFPSDPQRFTGLTDLYHRYRVMEPSKIRSYGLPDFFKDKMIKIEEELRKAKKKNSEYPTWFDFLDNYSELELREFALGLQSKQDDVKNKIEALNKNISKIQNQDHHPIDPTNQSSSIMSSDPAMLLGNQHNFIMQSSNLLPPPGNFFPPEPPPFNDQNDLIMQSSNSDLLMKLVTRHDNNNCSTHENFRSFPPETLLQPELPPFADQDNLNMQSSMSDSLKKMVMRDDHHNYNYNRENSSLLYTLPAYSFPPEIPLQPEEPPQFPDQDSLNMQSSMSDSWPKMVIRDDHHNYYNPENLYIQPAYSFQPEPPPFTDQENLIMQSSNPYSMMKLLMSEDDNKYYHHHNFSLQPLTPAPSASLSMQQPEPPPFIMIRTQFKFK